MKVDYETKIKSVDAADMSYQNKKETDKPQQKVTSNKNESSFAVDSISLQKQSSAFNLNIDGWEEIFDWLSLADLHAFGQTCKIFQQVTGKYFEWKYKKILFYAYADSITTDWKNRKCLSGFGEFVQRLAFYDREPDASILYAVENCKFIKEMEMVNTSTITLGGKRFENMLANLEILKISNTHFSNETFETLLKLCVNLKLLKIVESHGTGWMRNKYPKLEHLQLHECEPNEDNDLRSFFVNNSNVRNFTTTVEILMRNGAAFMANNIRFDDLTIVTFGDIDAISNVLINLYQRGFYKNLHFATRTAERLADLPALATLCIDTYDYIKIPSLPTVTEFVFRVLWNGLCTWKNMDEVSIVLTNLERVFSYKMSMKHMLPFIRNSIKLKEIKTCETGLIDPVYMNNERRKLKGARKVTIYVDEMDYLKIKWKYNEVDFGLIEIKRKQSYDGIWERNFGPY